MHWFTELVRGNRNPNPPSNSLDQPAVDPLNAKGFAHVFAHAEYRLTKGLPGNPKNPWYNWTTPDGFEPLTNCLQGSSSFSYCKGFGAFFGAGAQGRSFLHLLSLVAARSSF